MKIFEIEAQCFDEAKTKALEYGIKIIKNVTSSFELEKPSNFNEFAENIFKKYDLENTTGVGCIVVINTGSCDVKKYPYIFTNNNIPGQITKTHVYEVYKQSTGELVGRYTTKGAAVKGAKQLIRTIKDTLICKQLYRVDEDHELAFMLNYHPTDKSCLGKYIIFGN